MDYYRRSFLLPAHSYAQIPYKWVPHSAGQALMATDTTYDGPTHVPSPQYQFPHHAAQVPYSQNRNDIYIDNTADVPTHTHRAQTPGVVQQSPWPVVAAQSHVQAKNDCSKARTASNLEKHALAALSCIFPGKPFKKVRPAWLRNPRTGRLCELDFYSDELKLGVEVQGLQHYVYPNSWHKSRAEWEEQMYRDRLKEELCVHAGVTLVHVPFTVAANRVEQYIREEVQRVVLPGSVLHAWVQTHMGRSHEQM